MPFSNREKSYVRDFLPIQRLRFPLMMHVGPIDVLINDRVPAGYTPLFRLTTGSIMRFSPHRATRCTDWVIFGKELAVSHQIYFYPIGAEVEMGTPNFTTFGNINTASLDLLLPPATMT